MVLRVGGLSGLRGPGENTGLGTAQTLVATLRASSAPPGLLAALSSPCRGPLRLLVLSSAPSLCGACTSREEPTGLVRPGRPLPVCLEGCVACCLHTRGRCFTEERGSASGGAGSPAFERVSATSRCFSCPGVGGSGSAPPPFVGCGVASALVWMGGLGGDRREAQAG